MCTYLNKDVKKKKNGKRKLRETTKNMDYMTDLSSCFRSELAALQWLLENEWAVRILSTSPLYLIQQPHNDLHFYEPAMHFLLGLLCFLFHFFLLEKHFINSASSVQIPSGNSPWLAGPIVCHSCFLWTHYMWLVPLWDLNHIAYQRPTDSPFLPFLISSLLSFHLPFYFSKSCSFSPSIPFYNQKEVSLPLKSP